MSQQWSCSNRTGCLLRLRLRLIAVLDTIGWAVNGTNLSHSNLSDLIIPGVRRMLAIGWMHTETKEIGQPVAVPSLVLTIHYPSTVPVLRSRLHHGEPWKKTSGFCQQCVPRTAFTSWVLDLAAEKVAPSALLHKPFKTLATVWM